MFMGSMINVENQSKIGEINYNNFGSKMIIVKFINKTHIDIYFPKYNWIAKDRYYSDFIRGGVACPYEPKLCGVGYMGEGKYKSRVDGKKTKVYREWQNMLHRCYGVEKNNPTYRGCEVCEEWHNFQNFAKWYYENYYEIEGETMCLDKDILFKGNKIYSPQTCIFVPNRINTLFIKSDKVRGEYPIGVSYHKRDDNLRVGCSIYHNGKKEIARLGSFPPNKPFQAFTCYKNFKENYIKQIADEYKDLIPQKLYDAMYRYEVEIND